MLISLVVNIQLNYFRQKTVNKAKLCFLQYVWSNIKVELSKILNGNTKHAKVAKQISVKIFSISDDIRDKYLKTYLKLCQDLHMIKFIEWRRRNRKF